MEKTSVIQNFLELVDLTEQERITLIRELMAKWHLNVVDFEVSSASVQKGKRAAPSKVASTRKIEKKTAKHDISGKIVSEENIPAPETSSVKRRGRKKKNESIAVSGTDKNNVSEIPVIKRRGRPRKNVVRDEVSEPIPPASPSAEDAALIEKAAEAKNIRDLLDDEPEVRSKMSRRRNPTFRYLMDFPALKPYILGQEYCFEFLYQWKGKELLSPYVLSGLMPKGIYIPYKKMVFNQYHGFIVTLYDENVAANAAEASETAQKMPPVDNEAWMIMDSLQWSVLKSYINTVNQMLSKVGGDLLKRQYKTRSPKSEMIYGMGGFRYTVNVK